jgi:hypothetical protein
MQHLAADEVRHVFQNPLHQNRRHCGAAGAVLTGLDVPIVGLIVSAASATFCEELQGSIVPLPQLAALLRAMSEGRLVRQTLNVAWQLLSRAAEEAESRREEHNDAMRRLSDVSAEADAATHVRGDDG